MATAEVEPNDRSVRPRSYHDKSYRTGFLGTVSDFQKAGVLQDVVLEVEGRRFPCHRLVLSAASPYFRAMFTSDMAESRQKTVVLQGLHPAMLEEILSYIYSGTLHVSLDKVQPLYQAADLLQVDYVRETCTSYMAMNVERSTCLDLYKFADTFSVGIVQNRCLQCICRHFAKVCTTAEFCSLSVDQLTDIISQDGLDVKQETTVWEAVVRWVQHNEERRHHLPSILSHIRFQLLTSGDMAAILEHPLIRENPGSSEIIRNEVQGNTSNLKTRVGMDTQEMVLLVSARTNEIIYMNPRVGRHTSCKYAEICPPVVAATVTSDNDIYILAQESGAPYGVWHTQLNLLQYNHVENVWEHMSTVGRSMLDDLPSEEFLVEAGGHLFYLAVKLSLTIDMMVVVKKYNRCTHQWQECSQPRIDGTSDISVAVSCGPHLYFLTNAEVHRYDPSRDQWCRRTPPKTIPMLFTAVAMGTEIYCTDLRFSKTVVYDTESDTWRELPGFPNPTSHAVEIDCPVLFVLENHLHILLRMYSMAYVAADTGIYVYDSSAGVWKDMKVAMPIEEWNTYEWNTLCPVARMYLPCLNNRSTGEGSNIQ